MSEIRDVFEMTPMQASMLFQSLYAPGEAAYFQQYWGRLDGELDAAAFRAAWDAVIARHDILRAQAHWEDLERPALAILDAARPDWTQEDWSELDPEAQRGRLDDWLAADRARGFDLAAAPLLRFALIRLGPEAHVFVWSFHHLLLDGWCGALLVREMLAIYGGATPEAPPPPFRAYVDWRAAQDASAAQAYWTAALAGMEAPTPLGFERTRTGAAGQHERRFRLEAALTRALEATARRERLTLGALMQGAWALVLSRHAGQEDVVFGLVQAGRPADLPGAEAMIGLLLETVPVRAVAAPDRKVGDWLREIQAEGRARASHGHAALQDIQAWSGQGGATRLFDSLLIVETYPESIETAVRREGAELRLSQTGVHERTNFPLTIKILPGAEIEIVLAADAGRIPADALPRLAAHLTCTLETFAAGMEVALGAIDILTAEDHIAIAALEQGPERPVGPCALARFLAMAEARPEATAVETMAGERLSYATLAERARAIAAGLTTRGVRRGDVVAVCQDRACDLLASLIAVWRCGAAYLPLDPGYPSERIRYVLADAGAALALADAAGRAALGDAPGLPVAAVEDCDGDGQPTDPVAGDDLAYVLYTSGSTGRPKGVPIRHGALANFLDAMLEAPGVAPGTRMLALTTVAFDIAALELFGPLAAGGTVVLAPAGAGMDGRGLARMLAVWEIDTMQATPAGWRVLRDAGWTGRPGLKMLSGGEALDSALARDLMRLGGALWNLYGPTETTIWSAALEVRPDHLDGPKVPIGGPIANTTLSVRGPGGEIAPLGAPGELWIGGDGLSPGYLGRPELTAERFVTLGGARFYRTGDRARMNPDGAIDFLGRLDDQVKLRGHRIELGEIEARLEAHPGIVQAVAAVRGEGAAARLVAYLRCEGPAPDRAALRAHLGAALPAYMIPSAFVALDRMPLTPNGKIDRKALPAPEAPAATAPAAASPRDEIVAGIWAGVLGVGAVGPADDFFALGGHSLLATRAIGEIRRRLGMEPALRDLFEAPVLAAFCARLDALRPAPVLPPLEQAAGRPMLSAAQRRQWLLARLDPGSSAYHLPLAVALDGPLDPEALARALTALTARHDVLRCRFPAERGVATVEILPGFVPVLRRDDLGALSEAERMEAVSRLRRDEARAPFDLGAAPPWRARLVRLGEGRHVLLLTLHHILADEWSFGVMLDDLAAAYAGRELQPLPAQYPDFAAWQERLDLAAQRAFWRRALAGAPAWAALPADRPRPDRRSGEAGRTALAVSPEIARRLEALARGQGATPFLVLLAAWAVLIGRHAGETDLVIAVPVSNRRLPELHGLVGLFVNTLALRCDLAGDPDFATLLARLRETTLAAHAHQDLPFEQMIDALAPPRREGASPLAQVFFALAEAPRTGALGPDLAWRALPGEAAAARFDLSLELWRDASGLAGRIDFARDMFDQDTAERLARRFERLLEGLGRADLPVSTLPLLDEADLRIALPPLQPGEGDPAAWLERHATIRPDAPAVRRAGRTVSHADLRALLRDGAPDPLSRAIAAPTLIGENGEEIVFGPGIFGHLVGFFGDLEPGDRLVCGAGLSSPAGLAALAAALRAGACLDLDGPDEAVRIERPGAPPRRLRFGGIDERSKLRGPREFPGALIAEGEILRAAPGVRALVLDAGGGMVPPGSAGRLHLGGAGLARGHAGDPARTAGRFRPNPHLDPRGFAPGEICLIDTGFLARLDRQGRLRLVAPAPAAPRLGGADFDPVPIEAAFAALPGVRAAALALPADGRIPERLELFLEPVPGVARPGAAALATVDLPEALRPQSVTWRDVLPRRADGAPDRAALARGEGGGAPRDAAERLLVQIWCVVLGQAQVGRDENFFDLGGDSIRAVQIVAHAAEAGFEIEPRDLFRAQSVAALAPLLRPTAPPLPRTVAPPPDLPRLETAELARIAATVSFGDD